MTTDAATILAAFIGAIGVVLAALVPYLVRRAKTPPIVPPPEDATPMPVAGMNASPRTAVSRSHRSGSPAVFTVPMGGAEVIPDFNLTVGVVGWDRGQPWGNVTLPGATTRRVTWEAGTVVAFSHSQRNYTLTCTSVHAPNGETPRLTFKIHEVAVV